MSFNDHRNGQFGDYEVIYPKRTVEQQRAKLKALIGPPLPHPEWVRYVKNLSDEEVVGIYNRMCAIGRIND